MSGDAIVRDAMAAHDLKAVLAGFAVDGKPVSVMAWGESTGHQATPISSPIKRSCSFSMPIRFGTGARTS
ncbi:MAG TPA: hypothetical protein VLI93_02360 [Acetobacteraceae bacterium]|nr:hypothetical protein [Acetobacteraceae bacterium]